MVEEGIIDGVVGCDGEGNAVGGFGSGEGEAAAAGHGVGGGVDGIQVQIDKAVKIIEINTRVAIEFWDFKIRVWTEGILEGFIAGVEEGDELGREDVLEDC